jgi:hypothetical protein
MSLIICSRHGGIISNSSWDAWLGLIEKIGRFGFERLIEKVLGPIKIEHGIGLIPNGIALYGVAEGIARFEERIVEGLFKIGQGLFGIAKGRFPDRGIAKPKLHLGRPD